VDSGFSTSDPSTSFKSIVDAGYNYILLAFLVSGTPLDAAAAWGTLSASVQQSTIAYAHSKGARIVVSTGGSTDTPYNSFTGTAYGSTAATWAKNNHLDGLDFDLENFGSGFTAGSASTSASITWVVQATNTARSVLGSSAIITHAPQPPYFGVNNGFGNAYPQIYQQAQTINFLLVQYYNNGPAETYDEIFVSANGGAVEEIFADGVPKNKISIGKPVLSTDGNSANYISASTIHSIVTQAGTSFQWNTGVFGWQWHDSTTNGNWIKTIYP